MNTHWRTLAWAAVVPWLSAGASAGELTVLRFASERPEAPRMDGKEPRLILLAPADVPGMRPGAVLLRLDATESASATPAPSIAGSGRDDGLALKTSLTLDVGARRDDLRWSIADTDGTPDVLSELAWRDQKSLLLSARGEVAWSSGWWLAAETGVGLQTDGSVRDSDYDADGRGLEWSRSIGDAEKGEMLDLLLVGGHRFRLGPHILSASLGYAWHDQDLRLDRLTQVVAEANSFGVVVPPVGTRFDARSSYSASWRGPHLGIGLELALADGWRLGLDAWREWIEYEGSGNWALRPEFDHPESFTHLADGRVTGVGVGLTRTWGKSGRMGLTWERVKGRTGSGTDITHVVTGDFPTGFNGAVWDSESLTLEWQTRF